MIDGMGSLRARTTSVRCARRCQQRSVRTLASDILHTMRSALGSQMVTVILKADWYWDDIGIPDCNSDTEPIGFATISALGFQMTTMRDVWRVNLRALATAICPNVGERSVPTDRGSLANVHAEDLRWFDDSGTRVTMCDTSPLAIAACVAQGRLAVGRVNNDLLERWRAKRTSRIPALHERHGECSLRLPLATAICPNVVSTGPTQIATVSTYPIGPVLCLICTRDVLASLTTVDTYPIGSGMRLIYTRWPERSVRTSASEANTRGWRAKRAL